MRVLPLFLFSFFLIISCTEKETPKAKPQKWFKGNLHTHSYWSDGDEFPEVILDWYKNHDYQFLALSDHNTMAREEKWIDIREDSVYQEAFQSYLKNYGEDWVDYKIDSGTTRVKLKTFKEYSEYAQLAGEFLVIPSEEITDRFEDKHIHMNVTNIQEMISPKGGNSVLETMQNNLDQVLEQRQRTGVPMIPHINHPNFYYSIDLDDMKALNGERFFEVYNGHPVVHNMGDSVHISTEEMWDLINIDYLENNKPLMYGLATDDSHSYHHIGNKWSNAGRGWIMVQSDTLSATSLIEAMEAGHFYASTGVTLKTAAMDANVLTVEVDAEPNVDYEITFVGCDKGNSETKVLQTVKGTTASFELDEDLLFVRSKIVSTKKQENPIEELFFEMAWTQPVQFRE
ncbi:histidinol-phosphatase [Cytophaga sp. FL35]|uniref:histidinol-phosphatase n=1 Tax=Cytophaga sp. FL35 TaxID=1904456 RepID=UPI001653B5E6|nr:histidinol-phosphatase [Cytophaga sp. FL35]MBC6997840.1 histidinol-phosphatase [Cytophaga sp. FL35]